MNPEVTVLIRIAEILSRIETKLEEQRLSLIRIEAIIDPPKSLKKGRKK